MILVLKVLFFIAKVLGGNEYKLYSHKECDTDREYDLPNLASGHHSIVGAAIRLERPRILRPDKYSTEMRR